MPAITRFTPVNTSADDILDTFVAHDAEYWSIRRRETLEASDNSFMGSDPPIEANGRELARCQRENGRLKERLQIREEETQELRELLQYMDQRMVHLHERLQESEQKREGLGMDLEIMSEENGVLVEEVNWWKRHSEGLERRCSKLRDMLKEAES
jgi:chromosome segregation ATPase